MGVTDIRPHVALVMLDVAGLRGGGGAERFFADVYESHRNSVGRRVRLSLVTDHASLAHCREVGRLKDADGVHILRINGALEALVAAAGLWKWCAKNEVDILHIPLMTPIYLPFCWGWGYRRNQRRPAICVTQVDAGAADQIGLGERCEDVEQYKSLWLHRIFMNTVRLGGIYTWYEAFAQHCQTKKIRGKPLVRSANYCFVDTRRFRPGVKGPRIVFAGRMVKSKRPELFVAAIQHAWMLAPELLSRWSIDMYGEGRLLSRVRASVEARGMTGRIGIHGGADLAPVLAESSLFVSTQRKENFTSLAMLEAMASGNAVIAFDVGQTRRFVRDRENGLLVKKEDAVEMASAIIDFLSHPERHSAYGLRSREITETEHCVKNFLDDIEKFWMDVIAGSNLAK